MAASDNEFRSKRTSRDMAAIGLRENRFDLIQKFNCAAGAPSPAVRRLQEEFVEGKLEADETANYANVCLDLIDAAETPGM